MAGLPSTYISNKLAAEGSIAAMQNFIPAFLNDAPAIAGIEPQDGPVFEDSMEGDDAADCLSSELAGHSWDR